MDSPKLRPSVLGAGSLRAAATAEAPAKAIPVGRVATVFVRGFGLTKIILSSASIGRATTGVSIPESIGPMIEKSMLVAGTFFRTRLGWTARLLSCVDACAMPRKGSKQTTLGRKVLMTTTIPRIRLSPFGFRAQLGF